MSLLCHIHMYLSSYHLQHLANRFISGSPWGQTDTPFMFGPCRLLGSACSSPRFQQVVCSNGWFIYHTLAPPPFTTVIRVLTLLYKLTLQVRNMTCRHKYIHNLQLFFLFFYLTTRQVSWPQTLMSGISTDIVFQTVKYNPTSVEIVALILLYVNMLTQLRTTYLYLINFF